MWSEAVKGPREIAKSQKKKKKSSRAPLTLHQSHGSVVRLCSPFSRAPAQLRNLHWTMRRRWIMTQISWSWSNSLCACGWDLPSMTAIMFSSHIQVSLSSLHANFSVSMRTAQCLAQADSAFRLQLRNWSKLNFIVVPQTLNRKLSKVRGQFGARKERKGLAENRQKLLSSHAERAKRLKTTKKAFQLRKRSRSRLVYWPIRFISRVGDPFFWKVDLDLLSLSEILLLINPALIDFPRASMT